MRHVTLAGGIDEMQDVHCAERKFVLARVVKEVDGRQPPCYVSDISDLKEPIPEQIAPLLGRERVVEKLADPGGAVAAALLASIGPAFRLMAVIVKRLVQLHPFGTEAGSPDPEYHLSRVV